MVVAGFLPMLALDVLLIAIAITTFVQLADAYTYGYGTGSTGGTGGTIDIPVTDDDYSTSAACSAELSACGDDATCRSCLTADSSSAERLSCGDIVTSTSSVEACDANIEIACYLDELSEFECLENDNFLAVVLCLLEQYGCATDDVTCSNGDDNADTASNGAAASLGDVPTAIVLSCAFMLLILLL